jgi:hypothetical protein
MHFSSLVEYLQRAVVLRRGRKPRRRFESFRMSAQSAQIEVMESRALLSAGPVIVANPVIDLHAGNFTISNSAAVLLAPNATITSAETGTLNGGKLTVALTDGTSRDSIAIMSHGASRAVRTSGNMVLDNGVVVGTFTGGLGTTPLVITFNSKATIADAQAIARSITFRSIGHFAHQTNVTFQLTDGDGGVSNLASLSLDIIHGHNPHNG